MAMTSGHNANHKQIAATGGTEGARLPTGMVTTVQSVIKQSVTKITFALRMNHRLPDVTN
jgi:hypothetical protein